MYDCHLHTNHSFDAKNTMEEVCRAAVRHGMKGICFTDHLELNSPNHADPEHPIDYYIDIEAQKADFLRNKEKYGKSLEMCCGAEVGLHLGMEERIQNAINDLKPDFVIGSVHSIDNMDIFVGDLSVGRSKFETYMYYLERTLEIVKTQKCFNVLGHMDMILRDKNIADKNMDTVEYHLIIDEILKNLIKNGKGIEVNTSGWRYNLGGPHPHPFIIKRYKELGGRTITTGSDSHIPESINEGIDRATALLKDLGFTEVSYFVHGEEQRRKI
ncbi:MAG: histidinol-phosphatase HisJ family protein [Bacillota bacterium]|jgi:histidinol-phosphatase (PHP family)